MKRVKESTEDSAKHSQKALRAKKSRKFSKFDFYIEFQINRVY